MFEANTGPARVLSLIGPEELQQRFLPRVISGDISIGLAISEPDAGSAATDLTTRAKYADGSYTVNGGQAVDHPTAARPTPTWSTRG